MTASIRAAFRFPCTIHITHTLFYACAHHTMSRRTHSWFWSCEDRLQMINKKYLLFLTNLCTPLLVYFIIHLWYYLTFNFFLTSLSVESLCSYHQLIFSSDGDVFKLLNIQPSETYPLVQGQHKYDHTRWNSISASFHNPSHSYTLLRMRPSCHL